MSVLLSGSPFFPNKHPLLCQACVQGSSELVQLLLSEGCDPNVKDIVHFLPIERSSFLANLSPVHHAARSCDLLTIFKGRGVKLDNADAHGKTPLFYAVDFKSLESVQFLLQNGASAKTTCRDGRTPLHAAAERGCLEIVKILCDAGASVNQSNWQKTSPLHLAASYGRLDIVEELLSRGASIDFQDNAGYTALHQAASKNRPEIVKFLIDKNSNHLIVNNDGLKAFEIAPDPLKYELTEFVIRSLLARAQDSGQPLLTPDTCVFCQAVAPVVVYHPCGEIKLCDVCYMAHKAILRTCPLCTKSLKRVAVLNPVKEPEPIEEDPPEEEEKHELPSAPKKDEEEEEEEDKKEADDGSKDDREEADTESVATYDTSGST